MDREQISRSDLKKNFLKEIIMRFDFQGVLQAEMESVLLVVKPFLKEKMFNRYEERTASHMDDNDSAMELKEQVVYSFTSEASGYIVELSNTNVVLIVQSQMYSSFDDYASIFCRIVAIYNEKIDFFTPKRFGLRKINYCFIKNKEDITKYFNSRFYNYDTLIENYESQKVERVDRLSDGESNINLRYLIEEGEIDGQKYYKVVLDSDIYMMNQDVISRIVLDEEEIKVINEKLFVIYLNAVTDDFLGILISDEEISSDGILGVELNE